MSLNKKFFSIFTVALATAAFSTFTFAQDPMPVPAAPEKAEQPARPDGAHGRQFGHGEFDGKGFAGKHGFGKHGGKDGAMGELRGLNLTDDQKAQIKSIREANKPDKANFDQLKSLREAHNNGTPITADQKAQLKVFRDQSQAKMKSVRDQIQNVLTADQKAQIETRRTEMKQHMEQFRENRPAKPAAPAAPIKPITN